MMFLFCKITKYVLSLHTRLRSWLSVADSAKALTLDNGRAYP